MGCCVMHVPGLPFHCSIASKVSTQLALRQKHLSAELAESEKSPLYLAQLLRVKATGRLSKALCDMAPSLDLVELVHQAC